MNAEHKTRNVISPHSHIWMLGILLLGQGNEEKNVVRNSHTTLSSQLPQWSVENSVQQ
ncbi:unnamed protein product [Nezara viridula]|uniref:Uncharacterized protein n=1 Tax=Nezara viridula TaxID=85310 RepID=A0A9P0HN93_NEZVI|nr:unnamed protein product [Nezara viridula]